MLLASLEEAKALLAIDPENRQEDLSLGFMLRMASDWIEKYLNRRGALDKRERTEFYPGSGTQTIRLRAYPVSLSPVPEVWLDEQGYFGTPSDSFNTLKKLEHGKDFALYEDHSGKCNNGLLVRINNVWVKPLVRQRGFLTPYVADSFGNVKVTYTGGYASDELPSDIVFACVQLVARMRHQFPMGVPLSSESYEDRSISVFGGDRNYLMGQVKHLLNPYRSYRF